MAEMRAIGQSPTAVGFVLGRKLDSIPIGGYHVTVIGVLALVGFVEGKDLSMNGLLLVLAKGPLQLGGADIPWLVAGPTFMACVDGFMASAPSDHWSRKPVMQIGIAGTTFFTLLLLLVKNAEQLIVVRLLTGLAGRFAVSAPFPIAAELMPADASPRLRRHLRDGARRLFHGAAVHRPPAHRQPLRLSADGIAGRSRLFCCARDRSFRDPRKPALAVARADLLAESLQTDREREQLPPYWALFAHGQLRWTTVGILSGICAGTAAFLVHVLLPKALVDQGAAVAFSFGLSALVY